MADEQLPLALNASTDYVVYIEDSEPGNEYNVQGESPPHAFPSAPMREKNA